MKRRLWCVSLGLLGAALAGGCGRTPGAGDANRAAPDLVGAWRATLQFRNGPFAAVKDLEFMYVFNAGGTMTESSNYDGAPPVPPAYGIWRRVGRNEFEAKYEFYMTKAPAGLGDFTTGGGWLPAGRGVFSETITVSNDGKTFTSTIRYEAFDQGGESIAGRGDAKARGTRLAF
ncbi:MAG TPA: hypothetical protein VEY91_09360 [Candidatus Limnocylindria bacterium]|nr:hypothetical protein [Candidatus Limnocylindria bacterium]